MKIFYSAIFILTSWVTVWGQTDTTQTTYILNGQAVRQVQLDLLNPNNIDKIDVINSTRPREVRITTKNTTLLDYKAIKAKVGLNDNELPSVIVDEKKYKVNDILIDNSLIKKIKLTNNRTVITIRTKRKKTERSGFQINLRV